MGTAKRERQKANRSQKLANQAVQAKAEQRRKGAVGLVVVIVAVAAIVGLLLLTGNDKGDKKAKTTATTTAAAPVTTASATLAARKFTYGSTACPPTDGSAKRTLDFPAAPKNCLDAAKTYTATFDTTAGKVVVDLDSKNTPGTVNNFVFLARYKFYDNTKIFRANTGIDILQGGSPHTQDNSDPGPGYMLKDEGMFNADSTQGGYRYKPGDLVMARGAQRDGAGAQWFFVTGPKGSGLDAGQPIQNPGTYVVFGHVTEGLDIMQKILASSKVDTQGEGTPNPAVTVKSVTITEK